MDLTEKKRRWVINDPDFVEFVLDPSKLQERALVEFATALRTGRLIAFTGSYATKEAGYGAWKDLLQSGLPTKERLTSFLREAKIQPKSLDLDALYQIFDRSYSSTSHDLIHYDLIRALAQQASNKFPRSPELSATEQFGAQADKFKFRQRKYSESTTDAIVARLGIRRIVTLNYDHEAEFSLVATAEDRVRSTAPMKESVKVMDELYQRANPAQANSPAESSRKIWETLDGRRVISDSFNRERTDQLFEFAIGSSFIGGHVMHLHGRENDRGSMIITYSDYEERYRRSGITKLPFEHAMQCLFAGNPIVFIGTGQSEDEILSPLRQFISDSKWDRRVPIFAIWSPAAKSRNTGLNQRTSRSAIDPQEQLQRLRWYRQYGIYTIFDCELDEFDSWPPDGNRGNNRTMWRSIGLLARAAGKRLQPHDWKYSQFRSMSKFLPSKNGKPVIPAGGVQIWPTEDKENIWLPTSDILGSRKWKLDDKNCPPKHTNSASDYIRSIIDFGAPIKAVLDIPGSGHGYLVRLLRSLVTERQNRPDKKEGTPDTIFAQINAGFAWEFDTTFELISGLYVNRPAFGLESGDQISREESLGRYVKRLCHELANPVPSAAPYSRQIVICVNGADRFLDPSGYPLSSDLDLLLRIIPTIQNKVVAVNKARNATGLPSIRNPISLFLFGTGRIGRYLQNLEFPAGNTSQDDSLLVQYFGGLQPPFRGETERRRNYGAKEVKAAGGGRLTDRLTDYLGATYNADRRPLAQKGELPIQVPQRPLQKIAQEWHGPSLTEFERRFGSSLFRSGYLRATERALQTQLEASDHQGKNKTFELPGVLREELSRCRNSSPRMQRLAFTNAYLNTHILSVVLHDEREPERMAELVLVTLMTMAFVGQPVEVSTLYSCPAIRQICRAPERNTISEKEFGTFLKKLVNLNLIIPIRPFIGPRIQSRVRTGPRYGLHRALLHEIRDRNTVPLSDARTYTSFNVPLFAAQPIDDSEPKPEVHAELQTLIRTLIADPQASGPHGAAGYRYAVRLRAATASLRSYYTVSALLMHEPDSAERDSRSPRLTEHAVLLQQVIKAFEQNAIAYDERDDVQTPRAAFPHDIIWLQSQRGVALLAQGSLYEARHAFTEAQWINSRYTEPGAFGENSYHGEYWRHITLNQVHVDIERARLREAEDRLHALEQSVNAMSETVQWRESFLKNQRGRSPWLAEGANAFEAIVLKYGTEQLTRQRSADPVFPANAILTTGLTCLYRGWLASLGGLKRIALKELDSAIHILRNLKEVRALTIALRHRAALERSMGLASATETVQRCVSSAVSGRQMDLAHHAWLMEAEHKLALDPQVNRADILHQFNASLKYATATDMYRIEMEAHIALARLQIMGGDYDNALEHAAASLSVATRHGFGLRKISTRTMIGEILYLRGDRISGSAMLNQAQEEADRRGYQRAVERVHSVRRQLQV